MTIAATIAAFQSLHATIEGVNSAPVEMPVFINAVELPLVFTFPGATLEDEGWAASAGQWYTHRRYYIVRCYVRLLGTGRGVDEGFQETIALLHRFGVAYMRNPNLSNAVAHLGPQISDSGWRGDFRWGDDESAFYHGFQFQVAVSEKVSL